VTAKVLPGEPGKVVIEWIKGDGGRLGLDPTTNCIGIAAAETLKLMGQPSCGVSLTLQKVSPVQQGQQQQQQQLSFVSKGKAQVLQDYWAHLFATGPVLFASSWVTCSMQGCGRSKCTGSAQR
jgi:hypothetical protein